MVITGLFCSIAVIEHRISYGTFLAVVQLMIQLRSPLAGIYSGIPNYYSMIGSIERILSAENGHKGKETTDCCARSFDRIVLNEVCFSYIHDDKKYVIENVDLVINKGEFVGVFGPSGCGKSTLLKLLLSLYSPLKGTIALFKDNSETLISPESRSLFAYVPQDNQLMKGTIRDVICFGETYDEKKMNDALTISCCKEFIKDLDKGVLYELKEKGNGLSEGQMQRIAIARALYSDRPVLLLDEATNALNEDLELVVLNNLRQMTDKTVVLITHRKRTLELVDKAILCEETEGNYRWKTR